MGVRKIGMTWIAIVLLVLLFLAAVLFLARPSGASKSVAAENSLSEVAETWPSDPIGQELEFWKIIQETSSISSNQEVQSSALRNILKKSHPEDIKKFIGVFDRLMYKTYSWNLWGAAYTIHGGASDDSFEDFRKWLISRGREFFNGAVENPDRLADLIESNYQGDASFEEFSYIPLEVWIQKTGKQHADLPKAKDSLYPPEPFGEPFDEDVLYLKLRYPNLWKRFGEHPLG